MKVLSQLLAPVLPVLPLMALSSAVLASGNPPAPRDLSVPFVLNVGQEDEQIVFRAAMFAGASAVTKAGDLLHAIAGEAGNSTLLRERFVNGKAAPVGADEASTRVSYFVGEPSRWRSDLPSFQRIDLGEVWPGVRAELLAHGGTIEKRFCIAPGASPESIAMSIEGACSLALESAGTLLARADGGDAVFSAPIAWQDGPSGREPVDVAYALSGDVYGFRVGSFDAARELWIDPVIQGTYFGGSGEDRIQDIEIDSSGAVYVTGSSQSLDLPHTTGSAFPAHNGSSSIKDAFVAKLSSTLTAMTMVTYLGGGSDDEGTTIQVNANGVYVGGYTLSSDFPLASAGGDPTFAGNREGFIARLSTSLTSLIGASFFGGTDVQGEGIVDLGLASNGDVYVALDTNATNVPGMLPGSAKAAAQGSTDSVVGRFNFALSAIVIATYVGGPSNDIPHALHVESVTNNVFVAGYTDSANLLTNMGTGGAMNVLPSAFWGGGFVVKLNPGLSLAIGGTFYAVPNASWIEDIAQSNADSSLYVVGPIAVNGNPNTLPNLAGGAQAFAGSEDDGFVGRLAGDLQIVYQSSYIGGFHSDSANGVAVDPITGDVAVSGTTNSWDLPDTFGGVQSMAHPSPGEREAFVARLVPQLTAFVQNTYYGGSSEDIANKVAVAQDGTIYVCGLTASTDLTGMVGGAQPAHSTLGYDGFIVRFDSTLTGTGIVLPTEYCTPQWTTNSCQATMSATAFPSLSAATSCMVTASNVEGNRAALMLYTAFGRRTTNWCAAWSGGYLCLQPPIQRSVSASTGGGAGTCFGSLTLDWNAWHASHPNAGGNFLAPGAQIDVQCWFRDPGSCGGSAMSDAIELILQP